MYSFMYGKVVRVLSKSVVIQYTKVSDEDWERIVAVATLMAENKIGPAILSITGRTLTVEKVSFYEDPDSEMDLVKVRQATAKFHELSLIHGDLNYSNMGVRDDGDVVIIDYDWVHFRGSPPAGFMEWVKSSYDDLNSYEDYLNYELEGRGYE